MRVCHFDQPDELELVAPLWRALQQHHSEVLPALGGQTAPRSLDESWTRRRARYRAWLEDPKTFFVVARDDDRAIGYAFVTVGPAYAGWQTGRLATLETLSVLPDRRGHEVGSRLLEAVWSKLGERGIDELAITTALTNVDSQRFYERHGFSKSFVVYYGKRGGQGMGSSAQLPIEET